MVSLYRDARYGIRRLLQKPGFTATAVALLALGTGANSAVFSLVNAILLREEPLLRPAELVEVFMSRPETPYSPVSYPDFVDLRDGTEDVFTGMVASRVSFVPAGREGGIEVLPVEFVSGDYFPLLGVQARLGRTLMPDDNVSPGSHPVAVLGHDCWISMFGADEDVLGRHIRLTGQMYTIVGVVESEYRGNMLGVVPALYLPLMMLDQVHGGNELGERSTQSTFIKARLKNGVTIEQARASVVNVVLNLRETYPYSDWHADAEVTLIPTQDVIFLPTIDGFLRTAAWLLMSVVGLVLLLVCANVASLLLTRAVDRSKEIAVRLALGATPIALAVQLLTEAAILGFLGGAVGLVLGIWSLELLLAADLPLPSSIDISLDVGLDLNVLGVCLVVSVGTVLLIGLLPALQAARRDVVLALKRDTAGGGVAIKRIALRSAFVVVQVAVSMILLIGAGLFIRSFHAAQSVDPGFGQAPAGILKLAIPSTLYSEEEGRTFVRELLDRCERIPGVQAVGVTGLLHLEMFNTKSIQVNVCGVEAPSGRDSHVIAYSEVDVGFFEATGIRVLHGRAFSEIDRSDGPPVAIISEAMERRFWPGESGLGRLLRQQQGLDIEVVGIASDAKVRSIGEAPRPFIYRPFSQEFSSYLTVVAKTSLDPQRTAFEMMAAARALDPEVWLWEAETLERHLGVTLLPARLSALVLTLFAGLAIVLACVGLYGSVSYAVTQRSHEMGIRMSLGADAGAVIRTLVGMGMRLAALGGVIGLVLTLLVVWPLGHLLFAVGVFDPITLVAVPVLLGAVTLLAAYAPARRASRIDPASALRSE